MEWERYPRGRPHTVVGDVRVLRDLASPQLGVTRDVVAYAPPSHGEPGRRFPVVYMLDGQNLFDEATSKNGEWQVDETMEELSGEGVEAIVVGLPTGDRDVRRREYVGEQATASLAFLLETVKPLVEREFAVDTRREATGVAGSSLGAVLSMLALTSHPETFGFAGLLSPAFWWDGGDRWFELVERAELPAARVYLDVGDREGSDETRRRAYLDAFHRMHALLVEKGFGPDRLLAVLDRGGVHHESAWTRRLPAALRFLLAR